MKKLFSFLFFFAAINVALAQSKAIQKQIITLGGIESGSTVSIMQVLDYPVVLNSDTTKKIESFLMVILEEGSTAPSMFKVYGNKLIKNGNVFDKIAKDYLINMQNKKGEIYIQNIKYEGSEAESTTDHLVLKFEH